MMMSTSYSLHLGLKVNETPKQKCSIKWKDCNKRWKIHRRRMTSGVILCFHMWRHWEPAATLRFYSYSTFFLLLSSKKHGCRSRVWRSGIALIRKASTPRHRLHQESAFSKPVFNRENAVFYRKDRHFFWRQVTMMWDPKASCAGVG